MRPAALLLITTLALPPPAATEFNPAKFRADIAWVTAMSIADLASTEYMLRQCSTCYEANPFMREHHEVKKVLGTAFLLWILHGLRKGGHDTTADVLRWAVVGMLMVVTTWNVYLGRK